MASRIQLEPIKKEYVEDYIRSRLKIQNITISGPSLDLVYDYTAGYPFYFQKMGFFLYQIAAIGKKKELDANDAETAFYSMLNELDSELEATYLNKFSLQQQNILKYLSQNKTRRLSEISEDMQTPASSLTRSVKDLYNTMTVHKIKEGTYGIVDNVFRLWIKKNILGADYN